MVQHTNAIKDNWEVSPCWVLPPLLTMTVGFDNHSSLVGIRMKLSQETTLSKRRNIFLITEGIKCTGSPPIGLHFITPLLWSLGWKSKCMHMYSAPVLTFTWQEKLFSKALKHMMRLTFCNGSRNNYFPSGEMKINDRFYLCICLEFLQNDYHLQIHSE